MAALDEKITEIEKMVSDQQGYCLKQRRTVEALQADLQAGEGNLNRLEARWQTLLEVKREQNAEAAKSQAPSQPLSGGNEPPEGDEDTSA